MATPHLSKAARAVLLLLIACFNVWLSSCSSHPTRPSAPLGHDSDPSVSHDGHWVLYQHSATQPTDPLVTGVYYINADSAVSHLLVGGTANGYDWLPGNDSVVVAMEGEIVVLPLAGGTGLSIAKRGAYNISVSATGQFIAFDAGANFKTSLFILDRYSSVEYNATPDSMLYEYPCWSSQGTALAVFGGSAHTSGLFVVDIDGTPIRQLFQSHAYDRFPRWSPSGRAVAWERVAGNSATLWETDSLGAVETQIGAGLGGLSWLPDDVSLARPLSTTSGTRIFITNTITHQSRQLTR